MPDASQISRELPTHTTSWLVRSRDPRGTALDWSGAYYSAAGSFGCGGRESTQPSDAISASPIAISASYALPPRRSGRIYTARCVMRGTAQRYRRAGALRPESNLKIAFILAHRPSVCKTYVILKSIEWLGGRASDRRLPFRPTVSSASNRPRIRFHWRLSWRTVGITLARLGELANRCAMRGDSYTHGKSRNGGGPQHRPDPPLSPSRFWPKSFVTSRNSTRLPPAKSHEPAT